MADEIKSVETTEEKITETTTEQKPPAQQVTEPPKVEIPEGKTYTETEYNAIKTQLEQSQKAQKDFEYNTHIDSYVHSLNIVDDVYEERIAKDFKKAGIVFENGKPQNAEETLAKFKEKYPHAFKSDKIPRFAGDTQGSKSDSGDSILRKIMGLSPKK